MENSMTKMRPILFILPGLLMLVSVTWAGGVAPGDEAPQQPVSQEQVTATPAQTSAAVSKARQAVIPPPKAVAPKELPARTAVSPQNKAPAQAGKSSWMLGSREGACAPLASASRKTGEIGTFNTPQEFARKMQQRGHQAFVLDIGDVSGQVIRVKVPDMELDLTFVKAGMCR
jgi:vancomycin resistance protein YoaR